MLILSLNTTFGGAAVRELYFMAHSVAKACEAMGMVLARPAKTAADPHLEFHVLCPLGNGPWWR